VASRRRLAAFWRYGVAVLAAGYVTTAFAQPIDVADVAALHAAVDEANRRGGHVVIRLADGTYTLRDTLYVNAPSVTLIGQSADARAVIVQGDAMSATAKVGSLVRVAAANFELRHITLQRSRNHLIQIAGESNADDARIRDCILRDSYEQMLKVSMDFANPGVTGDGGVVENCVFEYTAGIGPQFYIGGVDAHGAKNWVVRGNRFRGIASPGPSVAEFAVHFWNTSASNVVERNSIVDCDRGIGFGLDGRGNDGGIIRNNMIYHSRNGHRFADTGIALIESPNTQVYNNTVVLEHAASAAIEYRFPATKNVALVNNLTNRPIRARNGASAEVASNRVDAERAWFVDVTAGDLRLAQSVSGVTDGGRPVNGLVDDFDGNERPSGRGVDIGAYEAPPAR
jgi:hypothetical protein